MKKAPSLYSLAELKNIVNGNGPMTEISSGKWVPARSLGFYSLPRRLKLAWGVFIGKYDALKWPGNQ